MSIFVPVLRSRNLFWFLNTLNSNNKFQYADFYSSIVEGVDKQLINKNNNNNPPPNLSISFKWSSVTSDVTAGVVRTPLHWYNCTCMTSHVFMSDMISATLPYLARK